MKRAKVAITIDLLKEAFGFDFKYNIVAAQINYDVFCGDTLELIVEGEILDDAFHVLPGDKVKNGNIILHTKVIHTEIKPV